MDDVISTRVVNGNIDNKDEEEMTPINIRGKIRGGTTATKMAILFMLLILVIEVVTNPRPRKVMVKMATNLRSLPSTPESMASDPSSNPNPE